MLRWLTMVVTLLVRQFVRSRPLLVHSISRSMSVSSSSVSSKYLISNPRYKPFLNELGLEEENLGVFDGSWFANGEVRLHVVSLSIVSARMSLDR